MISPWILCGVWLLLRQPPSPLLLQVPHRHLLLLHLLQWAEAGLAEVLREVDQAGEGCQQPEEGQGVEEGPVEERGLQGPTVELEE